MARRSKAQVRKIGPRSKKPNAKREVLTTHRRTLRGGKCSKGQMRTALLISTMLGGAEYDMEITWDWLTTTTYNNLYLDIYFPKYKLAVEYHGEQHFKYPNYFHKTKKEYEAARKRDRLKKGLLIGQNIKYIEWRFDETSTEKRAIQKLERVGLGDKIDHTSPMTSKNTTRKQNRISRVRPKRSH